MSGLIRTLLPYSVVELQDDFEDKNHETYEIAISNDAYESRAVELEQTNTESIIVDRLRLAWVRLLRYYLLQNDVSFFETKKGQRKLLTRHISEPLQDEKGDAFEHQTDESFSVNEIDRGNEDEEEPIVNSEIVWTTENDDRSSVRTHYQLKVRKASDSLAMSLIVKRNRVSRAFATLVAENFKLFFEFTGRESTRNEKLALSSKDIELIRAMIKKISYNPSAHCLHSLVVTALQQAPEQDAIRAWDGTMTAQDLDKTTNILAKFLVEQGVKVGDIVAFCFEKSMWTSVVVLAILKAGGAFVAIDPAAPSSRMQQILDVTKCQMILASRTTAKHLNGLQYRKLELIFEDLLGEWHENDHTSLPQVCPLDKAVVLFTSGSTGVPKGMILQHQAVCNHLLAVGKTFGYKSCNLLQFSTHTWDVFVIDVFTTWIHQGCVCIPSDEQRTTDFQEAFVVLKADFAMLTPSCAKLLDPNKVPGLKQLILGGEALLPDSVTKWEKTETRVHCSQMYGPAEVGICVGGDDCFNGACSTTIGYPLENFITIITDPQDPDRLVPVGATGELVVGGPAVVTEYLEMPEKTKESFIHDPPWVSQLNLPVNRFYRTGDLVHYDIETLDGRIVFVGRDDSQVKLRGQRLEPGEIEQHLNDEETVKSSLVSAVKEGKYKDQLVAVVTSGELSPGESSIRRQEHRDLSEGLKTKLETQIPKFMVPSEVIPVSKLPVKENMKLDRKEIEEWLAEESGRELKIGNAGRGEELDSNENIAQRLTEMIAELRQEEQHQVTQDFNIRESGLTSIQLMSLSMAVHDEYAKRIPSDTMMDSELTIRKLARAIQGKDEDLDNHGQLEDIKTEVQGLLQDLHQQIKSRTSYSRTNVLLTGVTSVLGIEIMKHLLSTTDCHVFALVRARNEDSAACRLHAVLNDNSWWKEEFIQRTYAWRGDLADSKLGLCKQHWELLTKPIDYEDGVHVIIHAGALVDYNMDYKMTKKVNVASLLEMLHAVSSTSSLVRRFVFVSGGQDPSREDFNQENLSGYTRSKIVCEELLKTCAELPVFARCNFSTVLPGYIIGSPTNPLPKENDFIWRLVAACIDIEVFDESSAYKWMVIASANHIAARIVETALHSSNAYVKLLNGVRVKTLWRIIDDLGFKLTGVDRREWLAKLQEDLEKRKENHPLFAFGDILHKDEMFLGSELNGAVDDQESVTAIRSNLEALISKNFFRNKI